MTSPTPPRRWKALLGGMAAMALFFAIDLLAASKFSVMGVKDPTVEGIVRERFTMYLVRQQAGFLGVFLLLGLWFSLPAAARKKGGFFFGFITALIFEISIFLYAVGCRPALYEGWFYEKGGVAAMAQVALVAHPHAAFILALILASFLFWLALRERIIPSMTATVVVVAVTGAFLFYRPGVPRLSFTPDAGKPDIILIAADSVRPDRLSACGAERKASPNIGALATEGAVFEKAFVPLARTFPSWVTILTGEPPWKHGVRTMFPDRSETVFPESLPHWLSAAGYETAVFSDYAGDIFPRMDAGFDHTDAPPFNFRTLVDTESLRVHFFLLPFVDTHFGRRLYPIIDAFADAADARHLTDKVLAWLARPARKPRFVILFYSTTHFPYAPNYPDVGRFSDPKYRGPFKFEKPTTLAEEKLNDADRKQILDLFDACVFAVDREVGRLVKALRAQPQGREAVVLFTADHGENLYEEGTIIGHGDDLHGNRTLQVPLVISAPNRIPAGARIPGMVSTMDIAPTLASLAGATVPETIEGKNLLPLTHGEGAGRPLLFFETGEWFVRIAKGYLENRRIDYPDITVMGDVDYKGDTSVTIKPEYRDIINIAKHRAVFDGRWKLIYLQSNKGLGLELYNTIRDPNERDEVKCSGDVYGFGIDGPMNCGEREAIRDPLMNALIAEMTAGGTQEFRNGYFLPAK